MIDIKELRRLAQAAMHPVTEGRWMRLFGERTVYDRMEDGCRGIPVVSTPFSPPRPFEAAYLDFIAAANPAAVIELLDRLEAAEKERDFAKTEIARLHDDIRELTDVRVLDEEDRDLIVAWRQGTATKPAPSVPEDVMRDAERYRYLRARDDGTAGVGCWIEADGRVCDRGWLYGVQLDSAIDSFIEVLAAAPKPEAKP